MNFRLDINKLFLLLILFLGALFRFYNLDKGGFWYDEIGTLSVVKENFPFGILDTLYHKDVHCPLFYFLLHFWGKIFGYQEFVLRFFSAIIGSINIIIFYLAGKEIKSRNTGLIIALLASVSPLLIYFSQEIRFYPLVLLFITLSLLFLLKLNNKFSAKNLTRLVVANLGILYTYTLGTVFVFLEVFIFLVYMIINYYKNNPLGDLKNIKNYLIAQIFCAFAFFPHLPALFHHLQVASESFISFFDWGKFKAIDIFVAFQNWFSPFIFIYRHEYEDSYLYFMEIFGINTSLVLFLLIVIIPVILYITGIFRAVFRKKITLVLFLIFFFFFSFEIVMALQGNFILHSKYTVLNLPVLIILAGYGLSELKTGSRFISYLVILNIAYFLFIPFSAPHMPRSGIYSEVRSFLREFKLTPADRIIINHGTRYVKDYFSEHTSLIFPLDLEYVYFYRDKNVLKRLFDESFIKEVNKNNAREKLRSFIASEVPAEKFENYIKKELLNKLPENARVVIFINRLTAKFESDELKRITLSEKKYANTSLARMLISKSSNDILEISGKYLKPIYIRQTRFYDLYIFKNTKLATSRFQASSP